MDKTYISIVVLAFTKISVCYDIGWVPVITYSEKMANNFTKAMLKAMEMRDFYHSTHIRYRRWSEPHTIILNDDAAFSAIITVEDEW